MYHSNLHEMQISNIEYEPHSLSGFYLDEESIINCLIKIVGGHELRTPLSIIQGVTEILEEQQGEINEKNDYFFDAMKHSISRIEKLSRRLGLWHKLRTNLSFEKSTVTINKDFVRNIINSVADNNEIKDSISIVIYEPQFQIFANSILVSSVFSELIDNAIKFSEKDKKIIAKIYQCDHYLNFSISNISYKTSFAELLEYKPFTQFNRKKFEQQGLGVGIDITSRGLNKAGGRLMISRNGNKASSDQEITFIAQFPI